ncbi:MAG: LemA family protein [Clostridia bacterium]
MVLVIFIVLIILIVFVVLYNNLISYKTHANNAKASIDVYLKKRFDLLPNLIETVKGYKNHEEKTLLLLTKLRAQFTTGKDVEKDIKLNKQLSQNIDLVAEAYPDLKAAESFITLQKQLESLEDELQAARRFYNTSVTEYNTKVQQIPYNLIAKVFKLEQLKLYEVLEEEKQKINVKM